MAEAEVLAPFFFSAILLEKIVCELASRFSHLTRAFGTPSTFPTSSGLANVESSTIVIFMSSLNSNILVFPEQFHRQSPQPPRELCRVHETEGTETDGQTGRNSSHQTPKILPNPSNHSTSPSHVRMIKLQYCILTVIQFHATMLCDSLAPARLPLLSSFSHAAFRRYVPQTSRKPPHFWPVTS